MRREIWVEVHEQPDGRFAVELPCEEVGGLHLDGSGRVRITMTKEQWQRVSFVSPFTDASDPDTGEADPQQGCE